MILLEAILYKHYAKHEPMAWAETFRHVNGIPPWSYWQMHLTAGAIR